MLQQERGELAIKLGFNDQNEMEIQGYYRPRKDTFAGTEVLEAYVAASKNATAFKKDRKAATLFREFRKHRKGEPEMKTSRCEVYTWSTADESELGERVIPREKAPQADRKPTERGRDCRTAHVLTQGMSCSCQEKLDFVSGEKLKPKEEKPPLACSRERSTNPLD